MAFEAEWSGLPNRQAIEFFRQKTTLPTHTWKDLDGAMHARAFVVAGATRDDLLADLRSAIDKAIAKGTTLQEFRKDFDATVAKTGWAYNGNRNWRTRVIYETNLRTAMAVGRHKQMSEPALVSRRPFWRYRHDDAVANPRPHHQAWDGTVLRHDDPWWKTHYPPNGWGCRCYVQSLGPRDLARAGKIDAEGNPRPDEAPTPPESTKGIDKGWDHNPGEAAQGRPLAPEEGRPVPMPDRFGPRDYPWVPARLDPVPAPVPLGIGGAASLDEMKAGLPKGTYADPIGNRVTVDDRVVEHIGFEATRDDGRDRYFPLIPDLIQEPQEIWVSFVRRPNGKVALRWRYAKLYQLPGVRRMLGLVAELMQGELVDVVPLGLEAMTLFRLDNQSNAGRLRRGWLAWPKSPNSDET